MSFNTVNPSTGALAPIPGTETSLAPYGAGYATCSTAEAATVKEATLSDYKLRPNGYVTVKFTHNVPAGSALRVNNTGGVSGIPIYYQGASIAADVIKAGDMATFIYDGTNYNLISLDSASSEIQALANEVDSIIQESVFTIEEEDGVLYLDWHGAAGECPYSTQLIGTNYELIFTYETI